jgi:ribose transport system permease protein
VDFGQRYALLLAWAAVIVVFGLLRPDTFMTTQNFQTIFSTQAIPLIVALGLVVSLTAGEYDLSAGSTMGFSLILVGYLNAEQGWPIGVALIVALLAAVLVGTINAFCIVWLGIDSIVATLGMGTFLAGMALAVSSLPISGVSAALTDASRHELFGLQMVFFYAVIVAAVLWYVLSYTPLGRYLFFVGANRNVARLSGIRVDLIRAGALIACSTIAGLAGILQAGLLGGADPTVGQSLLLPAFAAAYLGSTAILPGRFNAWGTFVGVYFLATGIVGLQLMGLSGWIEQVFYGAALVLAVALSRVETLRQAKSRLRRKAGLTTSSTNA